MPGWWQTNNCLWSKANIEMQILELMSKTDSCQFALKSNTKRRQLQKSLSIVNKTNCLHQMNLVVNLGMPRFLEIL